MKHAAWLLSISLCLATAQAQSVPISREHWVTTWATAQSLAPVAPIGGRPQRSDARPARPSPIGNIPETFKNQTVRMMVRTSIGGQQIRVQLSNALGNRALTIGAAHIALRQKDSAIFPASDRALTFAGRASIRIPPGALIVSDPVDLDVPKLADLAVSLYLPEDTGPPTVHPLGLHTAYIASGDATADATLNPSATTTAYFWLSSVDVRAPSRAAAIVAFGDSITDGFATTVNKDQAWPTLLAKRLASQKSTAMLGVLNLGISGNRVLRDGAGTNALARFDRDVLSRAGVRWMTLLEGINDITFSAIPGMPPGEAVTPEDLIWGYRQIIARAHMHGIKVAGATIMPVEGVATYTEKGEEVRQAVNHWIRTSGAFDAIIDFDALVRDPADPKRLRPEFDSGDHVHPNDAGNQAMADAVDISIFPAAQEQEARNGVTVDDDGTVHVPAQAVPMSGFLSPEAKAYVTQHLKDMQNPQILVQDNGVPRFMKGYLERQKVLYPVDRADTKIAGVHAYVYTPKAGVSAANRDRVLIDLHGGGFSGCWPGCAELESIPIAALGKIRVISLDYREAPKYKFPAASEDVAAVYQELLKDHTPQNIGIYGCSAGGMLTAMSVAWFEKHKLPQPGAVGMFCSGAGSPTGVGFGGDADYTALPLGEARVVPAPQPNAGANRGAGAGGLGYLAGTDPKDPLVAPINSPEILSKFPPTLIITGTRGFEVSGAIYTHTQLVKLGVDAELHVWEGLFHGFFYNPDVPESRDCYSVIVKFFDRHLGNAVHRPL